MQASVVLFTGFTSVEDAMNQVGQLVQEVDGQNDLDPAVVNQTNNLRQVRPTPPQPSSSVTSTSCVNHC